MLEKKSSSLQKQVIDSQLSLIQQGICITGCPFGYMNRYNEITGERLIKINPETAPIVKQLFELYSTNQYSLQTLNDYLKRNYQVQFTNTTLSNILTNPFYCGKMMYRGNLYNHIYETIVTNELFDKVAYLLVSNGNRKTRKSGKYLHLYKGLIRCAECDCAVSPCYSSKGKCTYYYCTLSKYKHPIGRPREEHITIMLRDILDSELYNYFSGLIFIQKRLLLNYLFKSLKLDKDKLIHEFTTESLELKDIKKFIENRQSILAKLNITKEILSNSDYDNIYLNLCKEPKTLDEIINLTGLPLNEVQSQLMDLQLDSLIEEINGKWLTVVK